MIEYEIALVKNTKKTTVKDSDIKVYLEYEKSGTYTLNDSKENSGLLFDLWNQPIRIYINCL